jgi:hypothetical protein
MGRTTKPLALVDADMLVYLGGFAAQSTSYSATWFDYSDAPHLEIFPNMKALKEWELEHPEQLLTDVEAVIEVEPVENALSIVKTKMVEIDKMSQGMEVYIKGEGNYRDALATLHKYKGNRTTPKPVHYDEIRRYLKERWGAVEVHGKEADDQITTRARQLLGKKVLLCHADKDLDQIPGDHWNYSKNVRYKISEDEALLFFYQQILSGDAADNIKGCWKLGTSGAEKIVNEVFEEWVDRHDLPDEDWDLDDLEMTLWDRVVQEYEVSMGKDGCPYAGMPAETVALENARLVWMQDEPLRLWTPVGYPLEYMTGGLDD